MSQTWQPIETAPKDGTKIIVWTVHDEVEVSEWFRTTGDEYVEAEGGLYRKENKLYYEGWNGNKPTHWMPLPPPPTDGAGEAHEPTREATPGIVAGSGQEG